MAVHLEVFEKVKDAFQTQNPTGQFCALNSNKVLWFDSESESYCVNVYGIREDDTVWFAGVPIEIFDN